MAGSRDERQKAVLVHVGEYEGRCISRERMYYLVESSSEREKGEVEPALGCVGKRVVRRGLERYS